MSRQPMVLQLNIPFCFHRCSYCSQSFCRYDSGVLHAYAEAMIREIASAAPEYEDKEITAISVEGGCPGLMAPADLQDVLSSARKQFHVSDDLFVSLQTMPGEYSRSLLDRMRDQGVNHWIFGIPAADERLHAVLERPYNIDTLSMADTAIRNFRVRDLSFELLYGIPGQTRQTFLTDLDRFLAYHPEHLSLLPFRLEPGTRIFSRVESGELTAAACSDMADMYTAAAEKLSSLGYHAYTVTDFALPGRENRYRLSRLRGCEQLGIGYLACSYVDSVSYTNGHSLQEYLDHPDDLEILADNIVMPDARSLLIREVCSALTLAEGLSADRIRESFGSVWDSTGLNAVLDRLKSSDLLEQNGPVFRLTPAGIASPRVVWSSIESI